MLRMAIEYLPESEPAARYLLIAYGQTGETHLTAAFASLRDLLEALRAAGISLEREEKESMVRDEDVEQHYVLMARKVELDSSHCLALGLRASEQGKTFR